MKNLFAHLFGKSARDRREIEVMYFGRLSELLLMTSERLPVPENTLTLGQVLHTLRERGERWAYELDDSHVSCTVNGRMAMTTDALTAGDEMGIYSCRSLFEK